MWLGPEMKQRIEELTRYWDEVSNAARGRGTQPIVSAKLADEVAAFHEDFLAWREHVSGLSFAPYVEDDVRKWRSAADHFAAAIRGEGHQAPTLDPWPAPVLERVEDAVKGGRDLLVAAALAGFAFWLLSRGKR